MNVWKCKLIFPTDTLQQKIEISDLRACSSAAECSNHRCIFECRWILVLIGPCVHRSAVSRRLCSCCPSYRRCCCWVRSERISGRRWRRWLTEPRWSLRAVSLSLCLIQYGLIKHWPVRWTVLLCHTLSVSQRVRSD